MKAKIKITINTNVECDPNYDNEFSSKRVIENLGLYGDNVKVLKDNWDSGFYTLEIKSDNIIKSISTSIDQCRDNGFSIVKLEEK